MKIEVSTRPTLEPVTLAEMKAQVRVDINTDDHLILAQITAAREWAERFRNQAFVTQTLKLYLDNWPGGKIVLPRGPVQSVTSVEYTDIDGNMLTYDSSNYIVSTVSQPAEIRLKKNSSWPTDELQEIDAIVVTYVAGYGNPALVPYTVKAAIKLLAAHLYENREQYIVGQGVAGVDIPMGIKDLLYPDRVMVV